MLSKVLVPLDGSPQAEGVLPYVGAIACHGMTSVTLYHIVDPETLERRDPIHAPYVEHIVARAETRARDYLHQVEQRLRGAVSQIDPKLGSGPAAEQIVNEAISGGYDLIAMSTHGRSGLGRWVLGSVADKVIHATQLPMLLIHPAEDGQETAITPPLRRVVVPLDGSELAEEALPYAVELARRLDLQVELLRVVQYQMGAGFGLYVEDPSGALEQAVRSYLAEIEARIQQQGIRVKGTVLWGLPGSRIIDSTQAEPGTVVVMSSHGRSGIGRWVLGSIADKVIRSADAPALVVRPTIVAVT